MRTSSLEVYGSLTRYTCVDLHTTNYLLSNVTDTIFSWFIKHIWITCPLNSILYHSFEEVYVVHEYKSSQWRVSVLLRRFDIDYPFSSSVAMVRWAIFKPTGNTFVPAVNSRSFCLFQLILTMYRFTFISHPRQRVEGSGFLPGGVGRCQ